MQLCILLLVVHMINGHNLLCDPSINWPWHFTYSASDPDPQPWNINHSRCEMEAPGNSSTDSMWIDVAFIFSNEANYPLNFTIIGNSDASYFLRFGIIFEIKNLWYYHRVDPRPGPSLTITYEWTQINQSFYNIYYDHQFFSQQHDDRKNNSMITEIGIYRANTDKTVFTYAAFNGFVAPTVAVNPTIFPTKTPTISPSVNPTINPTTKPTTNPAINPTEKSITNYTMIMAKSSTKSATKSFPTTTMNASSTRNARESEMLENIEMITTERIHVSNSSDNAKNVWIIVSVVLMVVIICLVTSLIILYGKLRKYKKTEQKVISALKEDEKTKHVENIMDVKVDNKYKVRVKDESSIEVLDDIYGNITKMSHGISTSDSGELQLTTLGELKENNHKDDIGKVKQWLETINFVEYFDNFMKNGYDRLDFIKAIKDRSELKDIDIISAQHQTRLLTEIDKLKNEGLSDVITSGYMYDQRVNLTVGR